MNNIGKTKESEDQIDPARAVALHAMLDLGSPSPTTGDTLPPFWHYAYFWETVSSAGLGRDGHPRTGAFIPDLGLPRRMWAGGSLAFHAPIRIGLAAQKKTKIVDVAEKIGRSGRIAIVTLQHHILQDSTLCVSEDQSLVYRAEATLDTVQPESAQAPKNETVRQSKRFTATDLFRYSALTFNGHRIHYDRDYSMGVEGYGGLVVHGPLLAQNLVHLAQSLLGELKTFNFRATAPLFDFEVATFCAKPTEYGLTLWVRGPDGRLCLTASAT